MSAEAKSESGMSHYRRLLGYAVPYWKIFVLAVFAMVLFSLTDATFALIMRELVDKQIVANNPERIALYPLLLVLIFFVRGLTTFVSGYCMGWIGRMTIFSLRREMFNHMLALPSGYHDQQKSGAMISRFTYDTEQVALAVTTAVTILIKDTLTILALIGVLIYLQGTITLLFFIVTPIIAALLYWVSMRFRKISRRIQKSMGDVTTVLQETIEGNREVKIYGGEKKESEAFDEVNKHNRKQNLKLYATVLASAPIIQFMVGILIAVIMYLLIASNASAGDFVAYVTAMLALMPPLKRLTTVNAALQRGIAAAESIFKFIDSKPEQETGTRVLEKARGRIEYRNVSFHYDNPDSPVLNNVSFTIEPGQTVAVIGRSGSGKTTLANLLPRFYETESGTILIDDTDVREYSLASLREQIALVSQHVVLFNDTVANNIAYGTLDSHSSAEIEAAAEAAHAIEFIREMENGMDTVVGEKGSMLSGGQRQRLAIARALLKNPPILILDEATSALDSESERLVQDGIERLTKDRTTLIIAHRLSTIETADTIMVLDNGSIVEFGNHQELLAKDGEYARYYRQQSASD